MFSDTSIERMRFLSRQLSDIADDGNESLALARLKEACPERFAAEFAALETMLGDAPGRTQSQNDLDFGSIAGLLPEVRARKATLLRGYIDLMRQTRSVFDTYWDGVVGTFSYLGTLAAIMMVISLVFGIWTIPSFQQLFTEFGAELPALTAVAFKYGAGFPAIAVVALVIVVLVAWSATKTMRRMRRLEPLPAWPSSVPLFGNVTSSYNQLLMLNFARLLMESGVSHDQAIRIGARETRQSESLPIELAIAAKLGNLNNEIAYQCEQRLDELALGMVRARDQFALLLKVVMYSLVAVLVIAMYLPIFKLGSVI